jgi:hypothetical protein
VDHAVVEPHWQGHAHIVAHRPVDASPPRGTGRAPLREERSSGDLVVGDMRLASGALRL